MQAKFRCRHHEIGRAVGLCVLRLSLRRIARSDDLESRPAALPLVSRCGHIATRSPLWPAGGGTRVGQTLRAGSIAAIASDPRRNFLGLKPPLGCLSRRSDTEQISWGNLSRLPCTVAESTLRTLDGYGLRGTLPAHPALAPSIRFLSIDSYFCLVLPSDPTSRRRPLHHH